MKRHDVKMYVQMRVVSSPKTAKARKLTRELTGRSFAAGVRREFEDMRMLLRIEIQSRAIAERKNAGASYS
jgi:hypothetical protein